MTRGFSIYLDALRFGAAFIVLLSHWAYPRFTDGVYLWIRELNLGSDAVVVFFVLSGLVVAFAADQRDKTAGRFAFARITRLLSVAFPALMLCYGLDRIGATLWPDAYAGWWYNPIGLGQTLWEGLSFTSQWGNDLTRIGTNGPYWSLSYEAAFYVLFGIALWTKGATRIMALTAGALLIGPRILILMPAWLMGVAVWHMIKSGNLPARNKAPAAIIVPLIAYVVSQYIGAPDKLTALSASLLGMEHTGSLGFSDEFLWNAVVGVFIATHLAGVASIARNDIRNLPFIRWLAGGSFSLYLVHYPLLQFLSPAMGDFAHTPEGYITLLLITFIACYLFSEVFERTLKMQRAGLKMAVAWVRQPRTA